MRTREKKPMKPDLTLDRFMKKLISVTHRRARRYYNQMGTFDRFSMRVGNVIAVCGMLETNINHFIKSLGKDPILAKHIIKLPLNRRINVLRDLLLDQVRIDGSRSQLAL